MATLIDSYPESNYNGSLTLLYSGSTQYAGQAFSVSSDYILSSAKFYLQWADKTLTGNLYAKVYNATGTMGTNARPTGSALATSGSINANTVTGIMKLYTFTFSGTNRINLTAGNNYIVVIYYDSGDSTHRLCVGLDGTSPTHSGNESNSVDGSTWSTLSLYDVIFYVYGNYTYTMSTSTGSFNETIINHLIKRGYNFIVHTGNYTYSFISYLIHRSYNFLLSLGNFILTGKTTYLYVPTDIQTTGIFLTEDYNYITTEDNGYLLLNAPIQYILNVFAGEFNTTGFSSILTSIRHIVASVGNFVLTGINNIMRRGKILIVSAGSFTTEFIDTAINSSRKIITSAGSFTITGIDNSMHKIYNMIVNTGNYVLNFIKFKVPIYWLNMNRHSSTFTNKTKHSATFTNKSKHSSIWTNDDKSN